MTQNDDHFSSIRPFEWLTSPLSLKSLITQHVSSSDVGSSSPPTRKALHVGSGSSTVGEYLVEELNFGMVVDVDRDENALAKMKNRWSSRCQETNVDPCRLETCILDFTKDPFPYPDNFFDLVLDKSTLDCTLCSDNATASLLVEVFRSLAIGGVYMLVSFHELELLLPLLTELPGVAWDVTHTTLQRQVETIIDSRKASSTPTHSKSPLNVLIARKSTASVLDYDTVCQHVHRVNDSWFQKHQPLLTRTRTQELQKSFANPLRLPEAYQFMFTDAEREHLTYEHFLEDWHAFMTHQVQTPTNNIDEKDEGDTTRISCETALAFLKEMQ